MRWTGPLMTSTVRDTVRRPVLPVTVVSAMSTDAVCYPVVAGCALSALSSGTDCVALSGPPSECHPLRRVPASAVPASWHGTHRAGRIP